jgi:hypothetical protein
MARGWTGGAALIVLSLARAASAQDSSNLPPAEKYGLRLQYREYRPSLTGDVQKGFADKDGTVVDVMDDLGLADKRTFDVRGTIQFKKGWKLRGSYMPFDYKGDTEVDSSFSYGETRYARFERVVTTMKGSYYGGDLEWDFLKGSYGFLGAVVGARVFDVDAALVNVSINSRELDTITTPMPVIGVATRLYAGRFSVEGELAGLSVGSSGSTLEAEGSVRIHVSDRLAAMGGYRYLSLDGKDGRDQIKIKLSGWQFGLELSL